MTDGYALTSSTAEEAAPLVRACFAAPFDFEAAITLEQMRGFFDGPDISVHTIFAKKENVPAGILVYEINGKELDVLHFGLLPSYRGRGIPAWIRDMLGSEAKKYGLDTVAFSTIASQTRLIRFYLRLGFRIDGEGDAGAGNRLRVRMVLPVNYLPEKIS
jgi:GNAT superfamily N-acetyltransferase